MSSTSNHLTDDELLANRLHLVTKDMDEVIGFLDAFSELVAVPESERLRHHSELLLATYSAAIVSYARGFLRSNSVGYAVRRLTAEDLNIFRQQWAKELHDLIVDKRDTMVAHADWEHHNTRLDKEDSPPNGSVRISSVPQVFAGIQHHQFRELASAVLSEARIRHFDIDRNLVPKRTG